MLVPKAVILTERFTTIVTPPSLNTTSLLRSPQSPKNYILLCAVTIRAAHMIPPNGVTLPNYKKAGLNTNRIPNQCRFLLACGGFGDEQLKKGNFKNYSGEAAWWATIIL